MCVWVHLMFIIVLIEMMDIYICIYERFNEHEITWVHWSPTQYDHTSYSMIVSRLCTLLSYQNSVIMMCTNQPSNEHDIWIYWSPLMLPIKLNASVAFMHTIYSVTRTVSLWCALITNTTRITPFVLPIVLYICSSPGK